MALLTRCKFFYGVEIEQDNSSIDFDDGSGEVSIDIPVGIYSPSEIADVIATLMSNAGTQTYNCVFNRFTRKLTISASASFSILISSGAHTATTLYETLGFTDGMDLISANTYTADDVTGFEFIPQFKLLDYLPVEHNSQSVQASINETGNGRIEVLTYGRKRMMECSIELITNNKFKDNEFWTSSPTGVEDAVQFLDFATQKGKVEFMPNLDDPSVFHLLLLESTESDPHGVGFKLMEQLEYGAGYFKTGKLVFREIT